MPTTIDIKKCFFLCLSLKSTFPAQFEGSLTESYIGEIQLSALNAGA